MRVDDDVVQADVDAAVDDKPKRRGRGNARVAAEEE
jgi:hypothetical protein